jgi:hypothetical protein
MSKLGIKRGGTRFVRDESGSATLEFLIWLPWLCLWLIFSAAVFIGWDSRSSAAKAAYTTSDLLSRLDTLNSARLNQIVALHDRLALASPGTTRSRFSSIRRLVPLDANDPTEEPRFEVLWSCAYGFENAMTDSYIPSELIPAMQPLDTVWIVEHQVPFTPISRWGGLEAFDWSNVQITRSRNDIGVPQPSDGCGSEATSSFVRP